MKKTKFSAGILLYKFRDTEIFFFWFIPVVRAKGEIEVDEDELEAAKREFQEETGFLPNGDFIPAAPIIFPGFQFE